MLNVCNESIQDVSSAIQPLNAYITESDRYGIMASYTECVKCICETNEALSPETNEWNRKGQEKASKSSFRIIKLIMEYLDMECHQDDQHLVENVIHNNDDWTYEKTFELTELVRQRPALWNKKDERYYKLMNRTNEWRQVGRILGCHFEKAKSKFHSLRGTYRSEKSRENKSQEIRSGDKKQYVSKWHLYEQMKLLDDKLLSRSASDAPHATKKCNEMSSDDDEKIPGITEELLGNQSERVSHKPETTVKSAQRPKLPSTKNDEVITKVLGILEDAEKRRHSKDREPNAMFVSFLAAKMKSYPLHLQSKCQVKMMQVISEIDLELFNETCTNQKHTSQADMSAPTIIISECVPEEVSGFYET